MQQDKEAVEKVRERAKELAYEHIDDGDALGWFEALYDEANGDHEKIPWADLEPNRYLVEWAEGVDLKSNGRNALVVGCGLGDDAKFLDDLGFSVTAFDVSAKAIEWAKKIHKTTDIEFYMVDLFDPPNDWNNAFDFVLEVYTIQALPLDMREKTIDSISNFVAGDGELLVVQRFRENDEEAEGLPWALSPKDLSRFESNGLKETEMNFYFGEEEEPIKRFAAKYER